MQSGFVRSLFDLSFTSFVTTRLMKVLYVLRLVWLAGGYLMGALAAFAIGGSALATLWLLMLGPLVVLAQAIAARVGCELIVVVFRIFEHTRDQLALTQAAIVAAGEQPSSL